MANEPFNISSFISNMTGDGARPNLFDITFQDQGSTVGENFTLRAEASSLPGSNIGVATTHFFGRQAKFAGNRVFGDWTVQILVDEGDFNAGPRFYLERWMNALNSHVGNKRNSAFVNPSDYQKDATIQHYGKNGGDNVIATYKMIKCFPINISDIALSWDANDQIERFSVTFAMQWWETLSGSTSETE